MTAEHRDILFTFMILTLNFQWSPAQETWIFIITLYAELPWWLFIYILSAQSKNLSTSSVVLVFSKTLSYNHSEITTTPLLGPLFSQYKMFVFNGHFFLNYFIKRKSSQSLYEVLDKSDSPTSGTSDLQGRTSD